MNHRLQILVEQSHIVPEAPPTELQFLCNRYGIQGPNRWSLFAKNNVHLNSWGSQEISILYPISGNSRDANLPQSVYEFLMPGNYGNLQNYWVNIFWVLASVKRHAYVVNGLHNLDMTDRRRNCDKAQKVFKTVILQKETS